MFATPMHASPEGPRSSEQVSSRSDGPRVAAARLMVLVVDDDPDFLDSMRFVLEGDGYDVVCASDGNEAMRLLHGAVRPELIVLDLMMPVKNGWQVWDELQLDPTLSGIPVIVMTSTGLRQGAVGSAIVLPKNISALVLLRKIAGALKLR